MGRDTETERRETRTGTEREGGQAGEEGGGGEKFLAVPSDFHGSRKDVGRCGDVNTQPWPPQAHVLSRDKSEGHDVHVSATLMACKFPTGVLVSADFAQQCSPLGAVSPEPGGSDHVGRCRSSQEPYSVRESPTFQTSAKPLLLSLTPPPRLVTLTRLEGVPLVTDEGDF